MKKLLLICFAATAATMALAQGDDPNVSSATKRYRAYRLARTEPSYGLSKVKGLIAHIKVDNEDNHRLNDAAYNRLSTAEKFTYAMVHGEDMDQNCNGMPWVVDEEKKVFAYPPGAFEDEEAGWSKRQKDFLHSHRGDAIRMIRSTIQAKHRVGINLKHAILELEAVELIPDLAAAYGRDHRDQDILTVFMLLMKDGKYQPFLTSATCKKLYSDDSNYQAFIEANAANRQLMVSRAMSFYKSKMS